MFVTFLYNFHGDILRITTWLTRILSFGVQPLIWTLGEVWLTIITKQIKTKSDLKIKKMQKVKKVWQFDEELLKISGLSASRVILSFQSVIMAHWFHRNPLKGTAEQTFELKMVQTDVEAVKVCSDLKQSRKRLISLLPDPEHSMSQVLTALDLYLAILR